MKKQPLTPERAYRITKSMQLISTLAACIEAEFQTDLIDTKFRDPAINNHVRLIKSSLEAINKHIKSTMHLKDSESFNYEQVPEMHRLFSYFIEYPADKINEFMNGCEELK